eukprot:7210662-Pyramimonas_sp.AAC.1
MEYYEDRRIVAGFGKDELIEKLPLKRQTEDVQHERRVVLRSRLCARHKSLGHRPRPTIWRPMA